MLQERRNSDAVSHCASHRIYLSLCNWSKATHISSNLNPPPSPFQVFLDGNVTQAPTLVARLLLPA
jgi:hypothetical protein